MSVCKENRNKKLICKVQIVCLFVEEMQHLATDFGNILKKNGLPPVTVKEGDTMMAIISSFQRYYMDADKNDLNIHMHTFGSTAVTVVMEAFRKYYLLVEKEAVKLPSDFGNEEVSEENKSVK